MKNREKYADKIIDMSAASKLALLDGKPVPCMSTRCSQCQFHCPDTNCTTMARKWLDSEYVEPSMYVEPSIDWSKVAVDTPIFVKATEDNIWTPRYFAKYENGRVYAWCNGSTFWSAEGNMFAWKFAKLAEREE